MFAWIAQLVEHPLGKGKVKDSSSFPGSVKGYVYILKSETNGRFYNGSTYTSWTLPFVLVFEQEFLCLKEARLIEYKLKKLKSKKIFEKIINAKKVILSDKGTINW